MHLSSCPYTDSGNAPGFYRPYVMPKFQDVEKSMLFFSVLLINILKISCKKHKAKMTHIGQRNQLKAETY